MFKNKEKKEIERKIRLRKAKSVIQTYISKLENLQKRVFGQGKDYAKLGENKMVRSQASKYIAIENRIRQAKKLLILIEEAEIQRELVSVSGSFIQFSKDIVNSIAEAPKVGDLTRAQVRFEEAMTKIEGIEEALNTVIDASSEGILTGKALGEEKIDEVAKLLEGEAGLEEKEATSGLDNEIDKKLKNVEELMKK